MDAGAEKITNVPCFFANVPFFVKCCICMFFFPFLYLHGRGRHAARSHFSFWLSSHWWTALGFSFSAEELGSSYDLFCVAEERKRRFLADLLHWLKLKDNFFFEEKGFFLKKKVFYLRSRFEDWRVLCWDGLLVICLLSHINSQRSRLLGKYTFLFRRPGGSVCFDEDVSSPIGFVAVPERCRLSWDVPMHWIPKNFCEAGALERHLPFIIVLD